MNAPDANSLQRLALLQRLATQQEDQAARQLADALARHANAEDRRVELQAYEQEYAARVPTAGGVQALSHHAGFLAKLREAIRFQAERALSMAQEVERVRARWIGLHREVEKLEQLSLNVQQQLRHHASRREGRELDELAQRGWVRQQAMG
ncbi:MAG: flagellar export protein FliJ [Pseudomonadota bacterium]